MLYKHSLLSIMMLSSTLSFFTIAMVGAELVENNGEYFIKGQVSAPQLGLMDADMHHIAAPAQQINIDTNNLGLANTDRCFYAVIPNRRAGATQQGIIVCNSGRVFHNVESAQQSITGTPAYLTYKNYIGSTKHPRPGLFGAGSETVYCSGTCKKQ
jgi:hypothetical protein